MDIPIISTVEDLSNFVKSIDIVDHEDRAKNLSDWANIMNKYEFKLEYNNIKIEKSGIHGMGVFATEKIPEGKIVTFYPADGIMLYINDEVTYYICDSDNYKFKDKFFEYANVYTLGGKNEILNEYGIIGDPNRCDNKLFIGHMLNDGIGNLFLNIPNEKLYSDKEICRDIFEQYDNFDKINTDLQFLQELPIGYIVTTREIEKGEELLTFYGKYYWYSTEYPDSKDPEKELNDMNKNNIK